MKTGYNRIMERTSSLDDFNFVMVTNGWTPDKTHGVSQSVFAKCAKTGWVIVELSHSNQIRVYFPDRYANGDLGFPTTLEGILDYIDACVKSEGGWCEAS